MGAEVTFEHGASSLARRAPFVRLLRPHQWYKNLLVFAGLLFGGELLDAAQGLRALAGFALFCVLFSGVYALNDAFDAQRDRAHPLKRLRPVAAGEIGRANAAVLGGGLLLAGVAGAFALGAPFGVVALLYACLQLAYAVLLRELVFLDLLSISTGLLLRAVAGVVLIAAPISPWLLACTFFLALFLGLGKRRAELEALQEAPSLHRGTLGHYSLALVDQLITIVVTVLILTYALYTFFHEDRLMMATVPIAVYGVFRYLHLVHRKEIGGEPEAIFRDPVSLVTLALWALCVALVLYVGPSVSDLVLPAQGRP